MGSLLKNRGILLCREVIFRAYFISCREVFPLWECPFSQSSYCFCIPVRIRVKGINSTHHNIILYFLMHCHVAKSHSQGGGCFPSNH